jgi:hypothetical protein
MVIGVLTSTSSTNALIVMGVVVEAVFLLALGPTPEKANPWKKRRPRC